jgi:DNA polymerase/3'-5' exonuclease PolX
MKYPDALKIATELIDVIKPYCSRIEIAGSVRRKKENVKDIEICLVPEKKNKLFNILGMFLLKNDKGFKYLKNGDKYKQFEFRGVNIDMFIGNENNWGLMFAIRTGSAEFSTKILSTWKKVSGGGYSKDGYLHDGEDKLIYTPEEMDVFNLCKMEWVEPEYRN